MASADEAVAEAAHGEDDLGLVGVILDLHPQAADVGVDKAGVTEVLVAPHPLEQVVARQHRTDVVGELVEQTELGLRQADLVARFEHDPLLTAKLDVAEPLGLRRRMFVELDAP